MKQLKYKDIPVIRESLLKKQNGKCALCGVKITDKTGCSLDHQHKLKSEEIGLDGGGLIRGVLCRACNVWEGKIWNGTRRYRQPQNVKDRVQMLKKLINFYETENIPLIHPTEKAKAPTVSKRNYNKLIKVYKEKRKPPEYPKSGKLTKKLQEVFKQYNIKPYN